jgi:hypothetical protein
MIAVAAGPPPLALKLQRTKHLFGHAGPLAVASGSHEPPVVLTLRMVAGSDSFDCDMHYGNGTGTDEISINARQV